MSLGVAFRAFFGALFRPEVSKRIEQALRPSMLPAPSSREPRPESPLAKEPDLASRGTAEPKGAGTKSVRNDAITLLSSLQREARLLDLVQESLEEYSDAQIGAAARDVLRDSKKVLQRMFDIQPLVSEPEGESIAIPANISAVRMKIVDSGQPVPTGIVVHPGWIASHCQLPQWTGSENDAMIIAPCEVEANQ